MRKNQPITVYGSITCGLDVNGKYVYNTGIRVLLSWAAGLPAPGALARSLSNLAAPAALSLRGSRGRASRLAPPRSPSPSQSLAGEKTGAAQFAFGLNVLTLLANAVFYYVQSRRESWWVGGPVGRASLPAPARHLHACRFRPLSRLPAPPPAPARPSPSPPPAASAPLVHRRCASPPSGAYTGWTSTARCLRTPSPCAAPPRSKHRSRLLARPCPLHWCCLPCHVHVAPHARRDHRRAVSGSRHPCMRRSWLGIVGTASSRSSRSQRTPATSSPRRSCSFRSAAPSSRSPSSPSSRFPCRSNRSPTEFQVQPNSEPHSLPLLPDGKYPLPICPALL